MRRRYQPKTESTKMRDTARLRGPSCASLARRAWGLLGFLLEARLCDVQLGVATTGMGTIWRRAKRGALPNRTSTPSSVYRRYLAATLLPNWNSLGYGEPCRTFTAGHGSGTTLALPGYR
jgi:hypothetical protein